MKDASWFVVLVICTALAWGFGVWMTADHLQNEAINRGYAQHNPTTGQWEWIDAESRQKSRQNVGIEPEEP